MAAYQHLKGLSALSTPLSHPQSHVPPPWGGGCEIQIYRWGHFTGQLRQETGNKKGRLFAASRTSVVRAFWKARLFLACACRALGRQEQRQSLGCHQRFANHPWIPTFPFDNKEGFGATVSRNPAQEHKTLHPSRNTPSPATGVPASWSDYVPEPSEPQAPHLGTELCPTSTNYLCPLFTSEEFSSATFLSFFFFWRGEWGLWLLFN